MAAEPPLHVASQPYPWPYDGLQPSSLALVLVGWDRHWASVVEDPDVVLGRCAALADTVVGAGGQVITVAHQRPRRRVASGPSVAPRLPTDQLPPTAIEVASSGIDGFFMGELDLTLRTNGVRQLVVAGLGLEGPVHSTLRSANDRGLECLLVIDACAVGDPALVAGSLSSVCMSGGIFGAVAGLDAVLGLLAPVAPSRLVPLTEESHP
jgi:nicotinamidase-related amidase